MNESAALLRHTNFISMLDTVGSRLSISKVKDRVVQTNDAPVRLTGLDAKEVSFISPLILPSYSGLTLAVELSIGEETVCLSGHQFSVTRLTVPYEYRLEYEMNDDARIEFYALINRTIEHNGWVPKYFQSYWQTDLSFMSHSVIDMHT